MGWKSKIVGHGQEPASQLLANPFNHRRHPDKQRKAVAASIREIGFVKSVIVNRTTGHVIDGHERIMQALAQGEDTMVDVEYVELSEEKEKLALLILDKTSELATVDNASLEALVGDVQTAEQDLADLITAMSQEAGLLDGPGAGEVTEDEVPEPPVDPITKPGDLWLLGEHRLLCGDSTKAEDVERLMAGAKADLCFTSPPYGVAKSAKLRDHYVPGAAKRESFYDQHEDDPDSWPDLMAGWFAAFRPVSECVICNVQMLADNKRAMVRWLAERSDDLVDVIVWDKVNAAPQMQANVLSNAFEFCFVFGGNASRAIPFADFHGTLSNVLRLDPRGKNDHADKHRAVFPLELPAWFMQSLCREAKAVADPFCGTGTTLIAAEQLGRKCYGMEISPAYCDVIVKRWETLTGKKAELETSNGQARPAQRADDPEDSQGEPRQKAAEQKRTKTAKR
jgi:DNA modification methylase